MRILTVLAMMAMMPVGSVRGDEEKGGSSNSEWTLAAQAWSFHRHTFFEAVDRAVQAGVKSIEIFPGQRLSADGEEKISHEMNAPQLEKVRTKLKKAGIRAVAYGVVEGQDEAEWRRIMAFARRVGVGVINAEPPLERLPMINRLCGEFGLKVGLHNHPRPSRYWNPSTVKKACKGLLNVGACVDTGHWMRSGIDPLEGLELLRGKIISCHFKDLNRRGRAAHDVPWGTGAGNAWGMLSALNAEGFRGPLSIEYEHAWDRNVPLMKRCVEWFHAATALLSEKGWQPWTDGDLKGMEAKGGFWKWEEKVLVGEGEGELRTKEPRGDVAIDLEFQGDPKAKGGLVFRCGEEAGTGFLVRLLGGEGEKDGPGAIVGIRAPDRALPKSSGGWNRLQVAIRGSLILVVCNGKPVNLAPISEETGSRGRLGMRLEGGTIRMRNLRIRPIE